jgi:hypothetical protein
LVRPNKIPTRDEPDRRWIDEGIRRTHPARKLLARRAMAEACMLEGRNLKLNASAKTATAQRL